MDVTAGLWAATILGLIGIIVLDLLIVDRRPHPFTAAELEGRAAPEAAGPNPPCSTTAASASS